VNWFVRAALAYRPRASSSWPRVEFAAILLAVGATTTLERVDFGGMVMELE
jgi:hypothetical protein